jgi:threonine dehydrogenase-like Zn-dependent dehydrogenase
MRRITVGPSLDDYGAFCRSAWRLIHAAVGTWGLARESLERLGEVVDVGLELKRATGRMGVDAAIETSGNEQALQEVLRASPMMPP